MAIIVQVPVETYNEADSTLTNEPTSKIKEDLILYLRNSMKTLYDNCYNKDLFKNVFAGYFLNLAPLAVYTDEWFRVSCQIDTVILSLTDNRQLFVGLGFERPLTGERKFVPIFVVTHNETEDGQSLQLHKESCEKLEQLVNYDGYVLQRDVNGCIEATVIDAVQAISYHGHFIEPTENIHIAEAKFLDSNTITNGLQNIDAFLTEDFPTTEIDENFIEQCLKEMANQFNTYKDQLCFDVTNDGLHEYFVALYNIIGNKYNKLFIYANVDVAGAQGQQIREMFLIFPKICEGILSARSSLKIAVKINSIHEDQILKYSLHQNHEAIATPESIKKMFAGLSITENEKQISDHIKDIIVYTTDTPVDSQEIHYIQIARDSTQHSAFWFTDTQEFVKPEKSDAPLADQLQNNDIWDAERIIAGEFRNFLESDDIKESESQTSNNLKFGKGPSILKNVKQFGLQLFNKFMEKPDTCVTKYIRPEISTSLHLGDNIFLLESDQKLTIISVSEGLVNYENMKSYIKQVINKFSAHIRQFSLYIIGNWSPIPLYGSDSGKYMYTSPSERKYIFASQHAKVISNTRNSTDKNVRWNEFVGYDRTTINYITEPYSNIRKFGHDLEDLNNLCLLYPSFADDFEVKPSDFTEIPSLIVPKSIILHDISIRAETAVFHIAKSYVSLVQKSGFTIDTDKKLASFLVPQFASLFRSVRQIYGTSTIEISRDIIRPKGYETATCKSGTLHVHICRESAASSSKSSNTLKLIIVRDMNRKIVEVNLCE